MKPRLPDQATFFELGLTAFLATVLGGLGVLLLGRGLGGGRRAARRAEAPPSPGSVPDERHQHTAAVSSR